MAIETKVIEINGAGYIQIGNGVTSLTAKSRGNKTFSVVVVPDGGIAPLVDETDIVTIESDAFSLNSAAADVYALANDGNDNLEIVRA